MVDEQYGDDGDEYIDETPEYSPKSDFSKARQVDAAVTKVIELRAKEMRAGYWNMEIKNGFQIKQWVPDSRKAFISSVSALRALMSPELARDEKYKSADDKLIESLKELKDLFSYEEKELYMKQDNKTMGGIPTWKNTGIKYVPEIGATVTIPNEMQPGLANTIAGGWDDKTNAYWDSLVEIYDSYFAQMNHVIDRLNYFKQVASF